MGYLRTSTRIGASLAVMTLVLALPGLAAASTGGDTSTNAMMNGGCTTRATCVDKLQQGDGIHSADSLQSLYSAHGITIAGISSSQTVQGTVTKSGEVTVTNTSANVQAGQVVASSAQSFGRTFLPGSAKVGSLFERPTSVSFATSELPALVHLDHGRFQWAMVESCGNIVVATPKAVAMAKTVAPKPTPAPAPVVKVVQISAPTQTVTQTQAAPTPAAAVRPAATTTPLPQTGASTLGLAGLSTLLVLAGYYYRGRRSLNLALLGRRG